MKAQKGIPVKRELENDRRISGRSTVGEQVYNASKESHQVEMVVWQLEENNIILLQIKPELGIQTTGYQGGVFLPVPIAKVSSNSSKLPGSAAKI